MTISGHVIVCVTALALAAHAAIAQDDEAARWTVHKLRSTSWNLDTFSEAQPNEFCTERGSVQLILTFDEKVDAIEIRSYAVGTDFDDDSATDVILGGPLPLSSPTTAQKQQYMRYKQDCARRAQVHVETIAWEPDPNGFWHDGFLWYVGTVIDFKCLSPTCRGSTRGQRLRMKAEVLEHGPQLHAAFFPDEAENGHDYVLLDQAR